MMMVLVMPLMTSCMKEIEFRGEETERKVVMNSMMKTGDDVVRVKMSYSKFFLTYGPVEYINDAMVSLWRNGERCANGRYVGNGKYEFDETLNYGDSVYVEALTQKGERVSARTIMPDTVVVDDIQLNIDENVDLYEEYQEYEFTLSFKLHDLVENSNYYQIGLALYTEDSVTGALTYSRELYFSCDDPMLVENHVDLMGEGSDFRSLRFSDESIDGMDYLVKLSGSLFFSMNSYDTTGITQMYLVVNTLSKDEYLYRKTYEQGSINEENPFVEPVMLYSNVKDGIGIFCGRTEQKYYLQRFKIVDGGYDFIKK